MIVSNGVGENVVKFLKRSRVRRYNMRDIYIRANGPSGCILIVALLCGLTAIAVLFGVIGVITFTIALTLVMWAALASMLIAIVSLIVRRVRSR